MQIARPRFGSRLVPSPGALVAIGVTIAIVAAAGFLINQKLNPATTPVETPRAKVTRTTITAGVNATGSAASTTTARLVFKGQGRVAEVLAGIGDQVEAGQVLARAEATDLDIAVQQAQTNVLAAQAKLDQVLAGARPEEVAAAQASLAAARLKLQGMQESRPEDVTAAQASLAAAKAKLAAMMDGGRSEDVEGAQAGVYSALAKLEALRAGPLDSDVVAARSTVDSSQANLNSARTKLTELLKGPTTADLAAAQAAVDSAQNTYASAQAKLAQLQAPTQSDIAAAQATVAQARASLRSAQAKRESDAQGTIISGGSSSTSSHASGSSTTTQEPASATQLAADDAAIVAAQANLASAQGKLNQLMAGGASSDYVAAQNAVDTAQANLASARAKLDQLHAGPLPADLAAAQSAVDAGEANLRSAQSKLDALLAGPSEADLVVAEAALVQARSSLALKQSPYTDADILAQQQAIQAAEATLAAKLNPSTESDIDQQRQAVRQAEANLALKQTPYLPSDILAAQAGLEQARANLARALDDRDGAVITSPFKGVVSAMAMNVGEATSGSTATGAGSSGGSPSITLVDPNNVAVNLQVDESDIARIEIGQAATVTFDALAGRRFPATVLSIAPAGTTSQGVTGFLVVLGLQNPRGARAGMTATAEITYDRRDNVLSVPNRAVTRQGRGDRFVQVVTPTGTEQRQVQVGLANDQLTEITDGLAEGEEVVIPATTARAAVPGAAAGARPGQGNFGGGAPVVIGGGGAARPAGR